eukprot:1159516-Pelagomonas_calceolata.AAC.22
MKQEHLLKRGTHGIPTSFGPLGLTMRGCTHSNLNPCSSTQAARAVGGTIVHIRLPLQHAVVRLAKLWAIFGRFRKNGCQNACSDPILSHFLSRVGFRSNLIYWSDKMRGQTLAPKHLEHGTYERTCWAKVARTWEPGKHYVWPQPE